MEFGPGPNLSSDTAPTPTILKYTFNMQEYVVYTAAGTAFEDFFRFSPRDSSPRMVYESGGAHFRTIKASEAVEGFRRIARTVPRVAFFGSRWGNFQSNFFF